jgi:hypothetical protein
MSLISLGGVVFGDFEIPGQVRFGGAQQLAVHRLIGGARVIDAMGRDDAAVEWRGVFSGADAAGRARMLDAMRAAGQVLSLSWDAFSYSVVIERLDLEYCSPWWIPYRITCTVVIDLAQNEAGFATDLEDGLTNDLNAAAAFVDVSGALAAVAVSDALTPGNADFTAASVALAGAGATVDQGIIGAGSELNSNDLGTLVSASGSLAQLCAARGYVGRAASNLEEAGT